MISASQGNRSTGELVGCPLLVAVLPFSWYGHVVALPSMKLVQVVKALNNALDYFGGGPIGVKSDNMNQRLSRSSRYEPVFRDMLEQWANYNHIALYASRPYKPKDKAPVETLSRSITDVFMPTFVIIHSTIWLS